MLKLYAALVGISLLLSYANPRPAETYAYFGAGVFPSMLMEAFIGSAVIVLVVFLARKLFRLVSPKSSPQ